MPAQWMVLEPLKEGQLFELPVSSSNIKPSDSGPEDHLQKTVIFLTQDLCGFFYCVSVFIQDKVPMWAA